MASKVNAMIEQRYESMRDIPDDDEHLWKGLKGVDGGLHRDLPSLGSIIKNIKERPNYEFVYLQSAVPRNSIFYCPYFYRVVKYQEMDRTDYTTLSQFGVTHFTETGAVFHRLDTYEKGYDLFRRLRKIRFFMLYRIWKILYVWRKSTQHRKMSSRRALLSRLLFPATPCLGACLLKIKEHQQQLSMETLIDISYVTSAQEFVENQLSKSRDMQSSLEDYRNSCVDMIRDCCLAVLRQAGYMDSNKIANMMYVEKVIMKKFYEWLARFVKLIDCMCVSVLHALVREAHQQMEQLMSDKCKDFNVDFLLGRDGSPQRSPLVLNNNTTPFFTLKITISEDKELVISPDETNTTIGFSQVFDSWKTCVEEFEMLATEPKLRVCTHSEYELSDKYKSKDFSQHPPKISFILRNDRILVTARDDVFGYLKKSYKDLNKYLMLFTEIFDKFKEDSKLNFVALRMERNLDVLKEYCNRFTLEIDTVAKIPNFQALGLFNVDLKLFKMKILDSATHLKHAIISELSELCSTLLRSAVDSCSSATRALTWGSLSCGDLVVLRTLVDASPDTGARLQSEVDTAQQLLQILEEQGVTVPQEDMQIFMGLNASVTKFGYEASQMSKQKDAIAVQFSKEVNKDITALMEKLAEIQQEAHDPWLWSIESKQENVFGKLSEIHVKVMKCQETNETIREWQKLFHMPPSRLEIIDGIFMHIELIKMLWNSLNEWKDYEDKWYNCNFFELNFEELQTQTLEYGKKVNILQKGLPPNKLLQELKNKNSAMKAKAFTIGDLRNGALRQRHWMSIGNILNTHIGDDLTLKKLEELKVFDFSEQLTEVSGLASSEAQLEALLKKVEDAWETIELPVIPHRDLIDTFILGSSEDVQTAVDESNMLVGIILSSKNCGLIRSKTEAWRDKLELFSKTLDEWYLCMQTWMYLEVLFCAPDIKRQLRKEARLFSIVDKSWKDIMRKTAKVPLAMPAVTAPGLLEQLKSNNHMLDQIMKSLEAYLEVKRVAFPRFYFLSNDELLEILAQTRNPLAVQPHLRKCFDAVDRLEFSFKKSERASEDQVKSTNSPDIVAMLSPEKERLPLGKGLKARGNVEEWLTKVELAMFASVQKHLRLSLADYSKKLRTEWVTEHPSQVVLAVSQMMWANYLERILSSKAAARNMKKFLKRSVQELNDLAALTGTDLSPLFRRVLCALITVDVHARDVVQNMVDKNVSSSESFEWQKMIRYYWLAGSDVCEVRMSVFSRAYGLEYLGAGGVLVITPLTDRCYLCLTGALSLDLGGAPAGPAGTGKTETTKDLAKALAVQCVVFNCSEGLDYKMMGRFFSGLVQCGAWCCFDEFNRINVEVLSVIAQQLISIRNAKILKLSRFFFEGREIKLVPTCAAFITMNPGYAGRTELPDNLKAVFRPISMMVPDYGLIAEVILYSEGFESSKGLAKKMVQMYKLCSEQLSQQDHYDFGMRAVKSVLVMAGSLKRASPLQEEQVTLMCALRDSNLPKFLADDAILFSGILGDLFPGVEMPIKSYVVLEEAMKEVLARESLQEEKSQIVKGIQLYETMIVRWGVMLVGPTGGGKSTVLKILGQTLTDLSKENLNVPMYQPVHTYVLNPKSIPLGELYGEINSLTLEWKDGLLANCMRTAVRFEGEDHQWIVCDGPVDAVWIENLNTVLDDNKMLCLANSERIKLSPFVHMLFEVGDLAQASPATVSRCGMVYMDPAQLGWRPVVKSWLSTLPQTGNLFSKEMKNFMFSLFELIDSGMEFIKKHCKIGVMQVDISKATMLCHLLQSLLESRGDKISQKTRLLYISQCFFFSYIWSVGGNLTDESRLAFQGHVNEQFKKAVEPFDPPYIPDNLWQVYVDCKTGELRSWETLVPDYSYTEGVPFFEILVPTIDTVRYGYIMQTLIKANRPVMFVGNTGVGKSVIIQTVLRSLGSSGSFVPFTMNFSAQTNSLSTQLILESRMEKQKSTLLAGPQGKTLLAFVDDVNMPKLDTYGSQPTIELLRQLLDTGGLYDRAHLFWKRYAGLVLVFACAPAGGGRSELSARFTRHLCTLVVTAPSSQTLNRIFKSILCGYLQNFTSEVSVLGSSIIKASVDIYQKVITSFLPTPAKSHYVFNLRDLSKCVQGMLQADVSTVREPTQMLRLFYHECVRVLHDRLVSFDERQSFFCYMRDVCLENFGEPVVQLDDGEEHKLPVLMFGDFLNYGVAKENRIYQEIIDSKNLCEILSFYLDEYNASSLSPLHLVLFGDAVEHVVRLSRALRAERGHALLVGPGGSGRSSLARLATHINDYRCFTIELTRLYDLSSFHDDLRSLFVQAGVKNEDVVFLVTDNTIRHEEFLEDINNMLNSGDVPNLFEADDREKVLLDCREAAIASGVSGGDKDAVFSFFISRVRAKLHLALCMSPVGDVFRRRCRMFPSLVNCCTIDWFVKWPSDALLTVATTILSPVGSPNTVQALARVCVHVHESVEVMTERLFTEAHRYFYTTPSSYLDLLKLYSNMLDKKRREILQNRIRVSSGLQKLYETYENVGVMEKMVKEMEPMLLAKSEETQRMFSQMKVDQEAADLVKQDMQVEEAKAKEQAAVTQALADDAARDLELVMPAMAAAEDALKSLNKKDINELRVFPKPPPLVKFVMEPVCLLLGTKPDWDSAKKAMADSNFLKKLSEYDKDHVPQSMLKKLKAYIDHPDFSPEKVAKVSKVCRSMCLWVKAMDTYAKVFKEVEPKVIKQLEAEKQMASVMKVLRDKQSKLEEVEFQLLSMRVALEKVQSERARLQRSVERSAARLGRAQELTDALGGERDNWEQTIKSLDLEVLSTPGDVLLAAAFVAYCGAFPSHQRTQLLKSWADKCKEQGISTSNNFRLIGVLSDAFELRSWQKFGLPSDSVSVENGIVVTRAGRWPLMIDPQQQANSWIRNMEQESELRTVKLTDQNYMQIVESCIRLGRPVLLEDVGEELDPTLAPILQKATTVQGGRLIIHLGDTDIEYDKNFRLYITTKLANPHYMPEICIQITLINFSVTFPGLEDQLLGEVVKLERPELELQRNELISNINDDRMQIKAIEEKILRLLHAAGDDILDDEELIETLKESKEISEVIEARLLDSEATEANITLARNVYRPVAERGAVLYFTIASLANVDPMYQYSLNYFFKVFNNVIKGCEKNENIKLQLKIMLDKITFAVYRNISRGLFEKHKLLYSFLLNVAVLRQAGDIAEDSWKFFTKGPIGMKLDATPKPDVPTLTDNTWLCANYLDKHFNNFKTFSDDCLKKIVLTIGRSVQVIQVVPDCKRPSAIDWDNRLNSFEKLCALKALKSEVLVDAIRHFVTDNLGREFTESYPMSLEKIYEDLSNTTPLVFILSPGSDPLEMYQKFAEEKGMQGRAESISLGQGQGPIAAKLIQEAALHGGWVFLQNCHLAVSWLPRLEELVQHLSVCSPPPHASLRLFLSSAPTPHFPSAVLQACVKVTNQPPKGLRANVMASCQRLQADWYEEHALGMDWRRAVFGLCMFHGVVQERKKFGPLGWTILYEFNDSDRECAFLNLSMFCSKRGIVWDALTYIIGEITYGGRVTDSWDQRCLRSVLHAFLSPEAFQQKRGSSVSRAYSCPPHNTLKELQYYAAGLPETEDPEIFGMHQNANIAFQKEETNQFISGILQSSAQSEEGGSQTYDDIVWQLTLDMKSQLCTEIDMDLMNPSLLKRDSRERVHSLSTVLMQEVARFNKLLKFIHKSLSELQKAIQGFAIMSDELEEIFQSFTNNVVPRSWSAKSYNSVKPLASWTKDLIKRINFIKDWMCNGPPPSSWISGLFFPQGLITGALQAYARRHQVSINDLLLDFHSIGVYIEQDDLNQYNEGTKKDNTDPYKGLTVPVDGINIHGLFIDAGCWDLSSNKLVDARPGELMSPLPVFHLQPTLSLPSPDPRYVAPLYKTALRAGVLSTTGHSTNFVIPFLLPSNQTQQYWILRGTALLTQTSD